jgi:hypothetical protein
VSRAFEDLAAELYRLPPGEFTARRNALAKELRADDRRLADHVAQLPKPALAAWALDVFAHEREDELGELLDLAAELREAQQELSRERMQALTAQAHSLVDQVVKDVARVAEASGNALSDAARAQVEQTLRAAMSDQAASDAVRAGLLAKPLDPGGFGSVDLTGAVAGAPRHVPPRPRKARAEESPDDGRDEKAERALQKAEDAQQQAESALAEADDAVTAAGADHEAAEQVVTRLRAELREAEQREAGAARDLRSAKQAQEKAAKRAGAAARRTEVARKAVEG